VPDPAWTNIVRLEQEIKHLTTLAEENQIDSQEFLQPILEQRSAFEHVCRAKAAEMGLFRKPPEADYAQKQYDKAMGHLYRAFFDVADWLGLTVKEKILDLVTPYDVEVIRDVMPEYYRDVRPRIESFIREVALIRSDKDIGQSKTSLITQVGEYSKRICEVMDIYAKLLPKVPALDERKKKHNKATSRKAIAKVIEIAVTVILTAIATWWFTQGPDSAKQLPAAVPSAPPLGASQ